MCPATKTKPPAKAERLVYAARAVPCAQDIGLRDFSTSRAGIATLICASFTLHRDTIADFAPNPTVVETLRNSGLGRVHVLDWRSAEPVDELEPPIDLVGLCQGGWLSLVYAAHFPHKVGHSFWWARRSTLPPIFPRSHNGPHKCRLPHWSNFVGAYGRSVLGKSVLHIWGSLLSIKDERKLLQIPAESDADAAEHVLSYFQGWYHTTVGDDISKMTPDEEVLLLHVME